MERHRNFITLADYLREEILNGSIPAGASLPNERELGGQAGVSRGSVREALRILEVEGLVSTKPGRNGGSTTQRPSPDGISRTLGTFVRGQQIPFEAVLEAREAMEPALAGLAALHRSKEDLAELAAATADLVDAGADRDMFVAANSRWHWAVAQASHNPLLIAIVAAIWDLVHRSNVARVVSAEVRGAVLQTHAAIEAAINAGDAEAAQRRMLRHVQSYRKTVGRLHRKARGQPLDPASSEGTRSRGGNTPGPPTLQK